MIGKKQERGKPPLDMVPSALVEGAARAFAHGEQKHGRWQWYSVRNEVSWSTWFAALLRHLFAWFWSEDVDKDSGLNHLDCAAAELAMLMHIVKNNQGQDNRPFVAYPDTGTNDEQEGCDQS